MSKVRIDVDLSEVELHAYEEEAERMGVSVRELVETVVKRLMDDEKRREEDGTDLPIIVS